MYLQKLLFPEAGAMGLLFLFVVISGGAALGENSGFHGTYHMRLSGTAPSPWKEERKLIIGTNQGRMSEAGYLHLPAAGSPVTNTWTKDDGAPVVQVLTISEDNLTLDEREECLDEHGDRFLCYTRGLRFAFSKDYQRADITGSIWSDDPLENQGPVTGSLTRAQEGGGGGGCFVTTEAQGLKSDWRQREYPVPYLLIGSFGAGSDGWSTSRPPCLSSFPKGRVKAP